MDALWAPVASAAIGAAFGSSVLTTWLTGRAARRQRRDETTTGAVLDAQDRLTDLRDVYRRLAADDPGAPSPLDLANREDALCIAADRTLSEVSAKRAHDYVRSGRLFVAGDPDTSDGVESDAYDAFRAVLRTALRRHR